MIVPMKRLTLVALKANEDDIMRSLQRTETVHIIPASESTETASALARSDERIKSISEAHGIIKQYGKKPGLSAPPEYTEDELAEGSKAAETLIIRIDELNRELSALKVSAEKHRSRVAHLQPFEALDVPIERVCSTAHARVRVGITDAAGMSAIQSAAEDSGFGCEFYPRAKQIEIGAIIVSECGDESVAELLKTINYQEFRFPADTGTIREISKRELDEAESDERRADKIKSELEALSKERGRLELAYDAAVINRDREAGKAELYSTRCAFVLEGWIKSTDEDLIRKAVSTITDVYEITLRDPEEDEIPPTALKNNKLVEPFESVTDMYSRPAYKGIDGTPLMTPFYLLFFGMMLGDTGYGLALFIGGLLYQKLLKPRGNTLKLAQVMTWCGLSTSIMGLILGTFFGMNWSDIFGEGTIFPLIDPLQNIMTMIILCCAVGLAQMMFGICVKIYMCCRDKDFLSAIFDNLSWIFLVLGLVGLLASGYVAVSWLPMASKIAAITGGAMILLFAGRAKKNIIKRVTGGLGALYNVTGYLSDTLSYVRLLALGLVGGAMGMVFNLIGSMIYDGLSSMGIVGTIIGILLSAVLLAVLHLFSLFINTLGTYVHCARLQYVEFFGKFYEANGTIFRPLGYNSKYIRVKKNSI